MTTVTLPQVIEAHRRSTSLDTLDDELTAADFEAMLSNEVRCESAHNEPDNAVCSRAVTHRVLYRCGGRNGGVNVCFNAARFVTSVIYANLSREAHRILDDETGNGFICKECRRSLEQCWHVIPA